MASPASSTAGATIAFSQEKYLERHRADLAAGSGAPVPRGVERKRMCLTSQSDGKVAFEMLDEKKEGILNKAQARCWLRCMGWCLLDSELDAMLLGDTGEKTAAKASRSAGLLAERTKWGLHQLFEINDANAHRQNASLKQLQASLRRLSNNRAKISRDRLMEYTTKDGGLSEVDLNQVLAAVGLFAAKQLDVDQLSAKVLDRICDPPAMSEMSDLL